MGLLVTGQSLQALSQQLGDGGGRTVGEYNWNVLRDFD